MKQHRSASSESTEADQQTAGSTSRGIMYALLLGFALITLLTACSVGDDKESGEAHLHGTETWQKTASETVLPAFLNEETKLTQELYSEVHNHSELMSSINCYCGCMEGTEDNEAHNSLLRCYWAEHPADEGGVTWTDHTTTCGICKKEMEMIVNLSKQGKSDDEIRKAIDDAYRPKNFKS
ncbi:hypothetical protein I6N90_10230 [Paenibacillus sp. GSMTC-2017]|uniref:PCYCGC motif-containing (lipo)protein n=1 Tax=Paenibacillus sp. GSMTC-2017 TaxID=2794350 RepID=UPI0018D8997A|nr:PCYCGC motif-containing (lipo)protein [Paenibacillus sp. GSMTC-2017]MBH5318185.1 hypothetical protein [Paenibacillus sp. GSMTC-2017]